MTDTKSKLHVAPDPEPAAEGEELSIAKPSTFDLNKFVSKRSATVASVETLQTALPHHSMSQAKDFVRLHPDEDTHWTPELCFLNVPIKGVKRDTLHLIEEKVAMLYLPSARSCASVSRWRASPSTSSFFVTCRARTSTTPGTRAT